jgi:hypothetical protein
VIYVVLGARSYDEALGDLQVTHGDSDLVLHRTFDQAYGDMPLGNGDPTLVRFNQRVAPFTHKLARESVVLDDLYANGRSEEEGLRWCFSASNDPGARKLWTHCARHHVSVACYGSGFAKGLDRFASDLARCNATNKLPRLLVISMLGHEPLDRALEEIVTSIDRSKFHADTTLFVTACAGGKDHVDPHRTLGLVAGHQADPGVVDSEHCTTMNILRSIETILGLPPMTRLDAAARPLRCFLRGRH